MDSEKPISETRIGISGWRYPPWRGSFYPKDLSQRLELQFASRQLNSIEINGSFYSLQSPECYQRWYDETPKDFCFAVKGSRFITHMKQLQNVEVPLANFFGSGLLALEEKMGPILWQFAPRMLFNFDKFEKFFKLLPKTTRSAARLSKKHDSRIDDKSLTKTKKDRPIRYAVEVRNESFMTPEFISLLKNYGIALVFADTEGKWPYAEDITADFLYIRLHGDTELYVSGYDEESLNQWSRKIKRWQAGGNSAKARRVQQQNVKAKRQAVLPESFSRDVYVYFDNDVKVRAPFDAMNLSSRLTTFKPAFKHEKLSSDVIAKLNREVPRTRWPGFSKKGD